MKKPDTYRHDENGSVWDAYATYQHARGMDLACEKHKTYIREILAKAPSLADLTIPDDQPSNSGSEEKGE
ncbi:hypothetical protein [Schaalia turicensis]|uniref:hypothetical protein n=1 Tax=Schaalia turicensis TaxID=131111 RepID=UPI00369B10C9